MEFLFNPNWVEQEWQHFFKLFQPEIFWGDLPEARHQLLVNTYLSSQEKDGQPTKDNKLKIIIPTGGSSAQIRLAIHNGET